MRPGITKHIVFFVLLLIVGQLFAPLNKVTNDKEVIRKTLVMAAGIFLAMTLLAFLDKGSFLGIGSYLSAGLVGLILARVGLWLAGIAEVPLSDFNTWDQMLSYVGVVLFAGYTAYDTQKLKQEAYSMPANPDYINASVHLYLDVLNLFINVEDILS